jgi:hypothetical protein
MLIVHIHISLIIGSEDIPINCVHWWKW